MRGAAWRPPASRHSAQACSEIAGSLGLKSQLIHARNASGVAPRLALTSGRKGTVELRFALAISLLVSHLLFFLSRSVRYAEEDKHSSGRQDDHSANLPYLEHDDLPGCLRRVFHTVKDRMGIDKIN